MPCGKTSSNWCRYRDIRWMQRLEKQSRFAQHRLRELPNMTFHLETLLNEVGIKDEGDHAVVGSTNVLAETSAK